MWVNHWHPAGYESALIREPYPHVTHSLSMICNTILFSDRTPSPPSCRVGPQNTKDPKIAFLQIIHAFPHDTTTRDLLRDGDAIYGMHFIRRVK